MASNEPLPFDGHAVDARIDARDRAARERAVDPRFNVALEASAGTGKTRVLVDRYVNLLKAGVAPANILAITFTRKAAAEMRGRILSTIRTAAERGELPASRWAELRGRMGDIAISTIDAFCLGLLREFPLEADLDPGFTLVDDTELPKLVDESLDRALRRCRAIARHDEEMALVFAQLGERRARTGLAALLHRRLVAPAALVRFIGGAPAGLDVSTVSQRAAAALVGVMDSMRGGFDRFRTSGPLEPAFHLLVRNVQHLRDELDAGRAPAAAGVQLAYMRAREHFLTQDGRARARNPYPKSAFANDADWRTHTALVTEHAEAVLHASNAFRRDLNVLVSRGVHRMFRVAETEYRRTLDQRAVLDFPDLLRRSIDLLRQMDEFARSRYRLESRYHHVLVDEFQDTSRAQWELVSLLIQSWGEGSGLADTGPLPPTIFIVGDRKQSIYGFRDADVSVLREAARQMELLRPDRDVRRSISRSFRAVPRLLAFVNDVCRDMATTPARRDAFEYGEADRFPIDEDSAGDADSCLALVAAEGTEACAEVVAAEVVRLLSTGTVVRDRDTGVARTIRPADIAVLFRSRESHREFEAALSRRRVPTYVYRGLGFFDTDEVKDVLALLWYLADPDSNLRTAALLRSRVCGVSDEGLRRLAPGLAETLGGHHAVADDLLDPPDAAALRRAREWTARWRGLVDRLPPAELLDMALRESGYLFELRGRRLQQARENLKKVRALLRRLQNRGYATQGRVAAHLDRLALGDEANAAVDALDAVHLMTVHASKGLEFPVVFVVNLSKGTGAWGDPVRVSADAGGEDVSVSVGTFQSDADEERGAHEQEETKRLLYVALTRARDRLYLASALKDGHVASARGSFSEVMPISLVQHFDAASATERAEWTAGSGGRHAFALITAVPEPAGGGTPASTEASSEAMPDDLVPLGVTAPPVLTVSSAAALPADAAGPVRSSLEADESDRLVGRVVHRLLQRYGLEGAPDGVLGDCALRMAASEPVPHGGRPAAETAMLAVGAYRQICAHDDVRALVASGEALREVPFSMRVGDSVVRGTIDCLIVMPGRIVVLEFKTGQPHETHRAQIDLYVRAAERLFPGFVVDARLVYAGATSALRRPDGIPYNRN